MPPRLVPKSALSQVVFVHDYVQLVFEDECFSLYNSIVVLLDAIEYPQGNAGFANALISLIGRAVVEAGATDECSLQLHLEGGARVQVLKTRGIARPEAFQPCRVRTAHFLGRCLWHKRRYWQ